MTKLATREKSILFMNNLAGDDLWEHGHVIVGDCPEFSVPHELFKYKRSSRAAYNSEGIYFTSIPYMAGKNEKVRIYGFPFLPIKVDPSDIEYPNSLYGLVVTQDMRMLDYLTEQGPNFHPVANSHAGRLTWAKNQNIPTILAVHHAEKHKGNTKGLSQLVGMDIFCPVFWHTDEPNADFFRKSIKALLKSC
jgi:hypothetical protein